MKDSRREELAEEFMASAGRIMRGMSAIFRREMERYEVTWPQFHLLKLVKNSDGITVTDVSHRLMISAPTASRMIDALCSKGLLERVKDSGDHRVTRLKLGARSESLMDTLTELQNKVMYEVFKEEDESELEGMVSLLSRITDRWLETVERTAKRSSGEQ